MLNEDTVIDVVRAEHLHDYVLKLTFSDGVVRDLDFGRFLSEASHPEIRKYLKQEKFKQFHIENGDLLWGDYDMCFPMADLYEDRIS
jgi:hypothetical protein